MVFYLCGFGLRFAPVVPIMLGEEAKFKRFSSFTCIPNNTNKIPTCSQKIKKKFKVYTVPYSK